MTADRKRRVPRGVTAGIVAVVLIGGVVVAWNQVRSSGSDPCLLSHEVTETDDFGGATPELARARWLSVEDVGNASDQPVFTGSQDDLVMADYQLDAEHRVDAPEGREVFLMVVTQRGGDGVWRVIRVDHCEQSAA